MKFAFMTFSTPDLELAEVLETARGYGYDGVEIRIDAKHGHGIENMSSAPERAAARKAAEEAGVALCCVATSCRFSDPGTAEEMVGDAHGAIDLAADIGAGCIRVFGGKLPEGGRREDSADLIAKSLASLADHATDRGVIVCMETHDDWCDPAHVADIVKRVDNPAIAINWDIMHPVRFAGFEMDAAFEAVKPWIRHVHFHDGIKESGELCPVGEGFIDHRRAVEHLLAMGYDGFLSGEWIKWQPAEEHLPRELATMKGYEKELSA